MKRILIVRPQEKTIFRRFLSIFRPTIQKVEPLNQLQQEEEKMPEVEMVVQDVVPSVPYKQSPPNMINRAVELGTNIFHATFQRFVNYVGSKLSEKFSSGTSKAARTVRTLATYTSISAAIGLACATGFESLALTPEWFYGLTVFLTVANSVAIAAGIVSDNKKDAKYEKKLSTMLFNLNDIAESQYRFSSSYRDKFSHDMPSFNSGSARMAHNVNSYIGSISTVLRTLYKEAGDISSAASLFSISRASAFISSTGKILTYKNKLDNFKLRIATLAANYIYCAKKNDSEKHNSICSILADTVQRLELSEENQYNEWAKFHIYKSLNELPSEVLKNKALCQNAIYEIMSGVLEEERGGLRGRKPTGKKIISREALKKIDDNNEYSLAGSDVVTGDALGFLGEKIKDKISENYDPKNYDWSQEISQKVVSDLGLDDKSDSLSRMLPRAIAQSCYQIIYDSEVVKFISQESQNSQFDRNALNERLVKFMIDGYSKIITDGEVDGEKVYDYFSERLDEKRKVLGSKTLGLGYDHLRIFTRHEVVEKVRDEARKNLQSSDSARSQEASTSRDSQLNEELRAESSGVVQEVPSSNVASTSSLGATPLSGQSFTR